MLKCEPYAGDRDKFLSWKRQFYTSLELINLDWAKRAREVEKDLDTKIDLATVSDEDREISRGLYALLMHLLKEDVETRLHSVAEGSGLEGWRVLCRAKLSRSSTACMQALMNPVFTTMDPRVNVQQWDRDAMRFKERFDEVIPESLRMHVYIEKISPVDFRQHILMDKERYNTSDKIRQAIESYADAREESDQSLDPSSGYVSAIREVRKDHLKPPGDKGDKGGKGNKGGKGSKGDKSKGQKGDKGGGKHGGDKGEDKGKGKLHKGLSKDPEGRAETRNAIGAGE